MLEKLARMMVRLCGEPYFPEGFVEVYLNKDKTVLNLRIGNRDIDINENMECIGAGTRENGWEAHKREND